MSFDLVPNFNSGPQERYDPSFSPPRSAMQVFFFESTILVHVYIECYIAENSGIEERLEYLKEQVRLMLRTRKLELAFLI